MEIGQDFKFIVQANETQAIAVKLLGWYPMSEDDNLIAGKTQVANPGRADFIGERIYHPRTFKFFEREGTISLRNEPISQDEINAWRTTCTLIEEIRKLV